VMRGVLARASKPDEASRAALEACPSMEGLDSRLPRTTRESYSWEISIAPQSSPTNYGIKRNILRLFDENDWPGYCSSGRHTGRGSFVEEPDGIFLSNGLVTPMQSPMLRDHTDPTANGVPIFGSAWGISC